MIAVYLTNNTKIFCIHLRALVLVRLFNNKTSQATFVYFSFQTSTTTGLSGLTKAQIKFLFPYDFIFDVRRLPDVPRSNEVVFSNTSKAK